MLAIWSLVLLSVPLLASQGKQCEGKALLLRSSGTQSSQMPAISARELPQYDALFRRQSGWTGADVASTVAISPGVTLWLFGDTWVGDIEGGKHVRATMVNNSFALQRGNAPPDARVEFFSSRPGTEKPTTLVTPSEGGFFWVQSGVLVRKGLFLFAMRVEKQGKANDAFGFRVAGSYLLSVQGPPERPDRWQVRQHALPWCHPDAKGNGVFLGAAVMKHAGFVYIYGCEEDRAGRLPAKHAVLARVPEDRLADLRAWRFAGEAGWLAPGEKPRRLFTPAANEYSVSWQPGPRRFVAVFTPGGLSRKIQVRLATAPEGPWEEPLTVYTCPEPHPGKMFCYAAKGHPELSGDNDLIVTYATNGWDFWYTAGHADLYWPHFIELQFGPLGRH